jgi:DtxR family manganese transport transcriptional regulator
MATQSSKPFSPGARRAGRRDDSANEFVHARRVHRAELAEDYVKLIDALAGEHGQARAIDMARRLGVSHVTVSRALGRLREAGLVADQPGRAIVLTQAGRELARLGRRRHEDVLRFLLALGVPPAVAAIDAEGVEHHVSATTLACMRRLTRERGRE